MAAVRAGVALADGSLVQDAQRLLSERGEALLETTEDDVLLGLAGGILGLLRLATTPAGEGATALAVRLGGVLSARAHKEVDGSSWPRPGAATWERGLTGLAHGAGGVGWALLELGVSTGEDAFIESALGAFDYERSCYDENLENWLDFRADVGRTRRSRPPAGGVFAWCHGAPGIALTRLRAWELTGADRWRSEALIALRATKSELDRRPAAAMLLDLSLCHGTAGLGEILGIGSSVLGEDFPDGAAVARRFAAEASGTLGPPSRAWPCGSGVGSAPGLLLGWAGMGYFYLRLHDPSLRSPLWLV